MVQLLWHKRRVLYALPWLYGVAPSAYCGRAPQSGFVGLLKRRISATPFLGVRVGQEERAHPELACPGCRGIATVLRQRNLRERKGFGGEAV